MITTNATTVSAAFIAAVLATGVVERTLPVVYGMQANNWVKSENSYTAHITGRKLLNCTVVANSFSGWHLENGIWIEDGAVEFPDDPSPNSSRPTGKQDFGLWRWVNVPESAEALRVTLLHNCSGRIRVTTVGPFEMEGDT